MTRWRRTARLDGLWREGLGVSVKELANVMKVPSENIHSYERGETKHPLVANGFTAAIRRVIESRA